MFIGIAIVLVLISMGGLIAFLGDRIGSKVGKKRMTLFGLRPKYTSIIVTIISGALISFSTIAVMAVVNENVRVALFGLSKLQTSTVQEAYDQAQAGVEKSAAEIKNLEKTKNELTGNINTLTEEKQELLSNIYALREGQVILRAGQVLTSVTVDENMNKEQTEKVLDSVLNDINTMLKQQMNVTDQNAELIRVSRQDFDTAVNQIAGSKTKKLVRIVAAQNLILGERLVVDFDIHDSILVFHKGETIYQGNLDKYKDIRNYELQVLRFLKDLNVYARSQGILPDPITGNVGALEGQELMEVIQKVKEYGGNCTLYVTARRDIYSQGPLLIDVRVERNDGR